MASTQKIFKSFTTKDGLVIKVDPSKTEHNFSLPWSDISAIEYELSETKPLEKKEEKRVTFAEVALEVVDYEEALGLLKNFLESKEIVNRKVGSIEFTAEPVGVRDIRFPKLSDVNEFKDPSLHQKNFSDLINLSHLALSLFLDEVLIDCQQPDFIIKPHLQILFKPALLKLLPEDSAEKLKKIQHKIIKRIEKVLKKGNWGELEKIQKLIESGYPEFPSRDHTASWLKIYLAGEAGHNHSYVFNFLDFLIQHGAKVVCAPGKTQPLDLLFNKPFDPNMHGKLLISLKCTTELLIKAGGNSHPLATVTLAQRNNYPQELLELISPPVIEAPAPTPKSRCVIF